MNTTWVMLTIVISLGMDPNNKPAPLVRFSGELYATEKACLDSAKEPGWFEDKNQVVALCVEAKAVFISPKQYIPRPKK